MRVKIGVTEPAELQPLKIRWHLVPIQSQFGPENGFSIWSLLIFELLNVVAGGCFIKFLG